MRPTLAPGDEVLVDPRAFRDRSPQIGELVVARHPFKKGVRIVKRVQAADGDGRWVLVGDNPAESSDSRGFGSLPARAILGKVTSRFGG